MRHTSLLKAYLFSRTLKQWCKRNGYDIGNAGAYVLTALSELQKDSGRITIAALQTHLKRNRHYYGSNIIDAHLAKLCAYGLAEKSGRYPSTHALTLAGRNAVNDLEKKLRSARADK